MRIFEFFLWSQGVKVRPATGGEKAVLSPVLGQFGTRKFGTGQCHDVKFSFFVPTVSKCLVPNCPGFEDSLQLVSSWAKCQRKEHLADVSNEKLDATCVSVC